MSRIIYHCTHWMEGEGNCCRCGEPNWCPDSGETEEALADAEAREGTCKYDEGDMVSRSQ